MLPHHLNTSLSVSIYKMGSVISGSKLSGHKECYLWYMCVVGMFRTLTAEATLQGSL